MSAVVKKTAKKKSLLLSAKPKREAILYARVSNETKEFVNKLARKLNRYPNEVVEAILKKAQQEEGENTPVNKK